MLCVMDIAEQARTWLGTRFRYGGRVKKNESNDGGVDCVGLVIGVYGELGCDLSKYDKFYAKSDAHCLRDNLAVIFNRVSVATIGDLILHENHLMLFLGQSTMHASAIARKVVEHNISDLINCEFYRINGVHEGIRTPDLRLRRPSLYPTELRER